MLTQSTQIILIINFGASLMKNLNHSLIFQLLVSFLLFSSSSGAATITVGSSSSDALDGTDGVCSLREAVINANNDEATYADCEAGDGDDIVLLQDGVTYELSIPGSSENNSTTGDLDFSSTITIKAETGATISGQQLIDDGSPDRILHVQDDQNVTIQNLTIKNGKIVTGAQYNGGGLLRINEGATVTISGCTFEDGEVLNTSSASGTKGGGAIQAFSNTTLSISDTTIQNNTMTCENENCFGGGISTLGHLSLTQVTVFSNTLTANADAKTAYGAGIYIDSPSSPSPYNITFDKVSILKNTGTAKSAYGGGVYANVSEGGSFTMLNSTISENSALASSGTALGGGLVVFFAWTSEELRANVSHTTITENLAQNDTGESYGGGITAVMVALKNSLIANNESTSTDSGIEEGPDCWTDPDETESSGLYSSGYNLITSTSHCTNLVFAETDITDQTMSVNQVADNGGATKTVAIDTDSLAYNSGSCTDNEGNTVSSDQRGASRDENCDIGAYEYLHFYEDSDGDGYGDQDSTATTTYSSSYVTNHTDCDDSSSTVSPDAEEVCEDGIDNDCDGNIDEDCSSTITDEESGDDTSVDDSSSNGEETGGEVSDDEDSNNTSNESSSSSEADSQTTTSSSGCSLTLSAKSQNHNQWILFSIVVMGIFFWRSHLLRKNV